MLQRNIFFKMGFWTIILAVVVGLVAFAILFSIYALLSPPAVNGKKGDIRECNGHISQDEVWRKSPKNPANMPYPFNLLYPSKPVKH